MKMKNAMSVFAVLSLVTGCAASTEPTAEPDEGTAEVAAEPAGPAERDNAAEEQAVGEAAMALTLTCNSGTLLCCNSVQSPTSYTVTTLAGLLGISLGSVSSSVGLTCSPMANGDSNSCNAVPTCCQNNSYGGLLALNCSSPNIVIE